jgi:uncharacterized damage-inducible protein DinB
MADGTLVRLFEHNNWANRMMIRACADLSDAELDAAPQSATLGSIRETLAHLVGAQHGYLSLLTLPVEERQRPEPAFAELEVAARVSGEGLLALVRDEAALGAGGVVESRDGWLIHPWVVLVQVINHATEHREQVASMLTALGYTPPELDGWAFGEATGAAVEKSP